MMDGGKFEEAIGHTFDVRNLLVNVVSYFQRTIIKRFIDPQFKVQVRVQVYVPRRGLGITP